jgi:hypothetical protein
LKSNESGGKSWRVRRRIELGEFLVQSNILCNAHRQCSVK